MLTCYRCARIIQGKVISTNPPNLHIRLGIDFPKSFHAICYGAHKREEEARASKELNS